MKFWTLLNQKAVFENQSLDTNKIGKPGEYPFTRGLHQEGYRKRPWTIRQYSGFGTPEETNRRFKFLLDQGQTGLSIAFDLPTQMGYDPDHKSARGEVGRVGVSIFSINEMEEVLKDIPLDKISISMTINATAPILVAMLQVAAERRGFSPEQIMGTAQNDILKEYVARGTYIFPPKPSLRLAADLIVYCAAKFPKFNPISVSGYHMRDAGCTIEQEMGFALANGLTYINAALARGVKIDDFAPRISWIFNSQNEFFAEVAKYRALRRMWARLLKERYGAKDPRSLQLRVHVQTGGSTLMAQQPENNIVRAAYQAMASVIGGVQSLALSCFDEALAIPTERSQALALRTQQIIAHETGVCEVVDPMGGAPYIEELTDELERRANYWMELALGSVKPPLAQSTIEAIESGLIQTAIDDSAYKQQQQIENRERIIVGVNQYVEDNNIKDKSHFVGGSFRHDKASEEKATAGLRALRERRDNEKLAASLRNLGEAAATVSISLMDPILEAVRAQATVGEIVTQLRNVFGEYKSLHQSAP